MKLPKNLQYKLFTREKNNSIRSLQNQSNLIDFSSNDYIGFAYSEDIFDQTHQYLISQNFKINGATGSRLISGNHSIYEITENFIAKFHQAEKALIFNSGYDANLGFFGSVPQRNDIIVYDELCHASIRDGLQMSLAKSYKFTHNDYESLEKLLEKHKDINESNSLYIVTESVFSMDGDSPNFEILVPLSEKYNAYLVVDEAHALGVFGDKGEGLLQYQNLHHKVFARIVTFGKGLGCHGAAILGSKEIITYLINFSRSFIYTTGLSPHSVANILISYQELLTTTNIYTLKENITFFNQQIQLHGLKQLFIYSKSAIHCAIIPGVSKVKEIALKLNKNGFNTKAILSPTVPEGQERIRFCLHSYNSKEEILKLVLELNKMIFYEN